MDPIVVALQLASGGVGLTLTLIIFNMWRNGDLVPRVVLETALKAYQKADELREAARHEEAAQNRDLQRALLEALEERNGRSRHGRDF